MKNANEFGNGVFLVRMENGEIVHSHCVAEGVPEQTRLLVHFVGDGTVNSFVLREDELVASLQTLRELCLQAGILPFPYG